MGGRGGVYYVPNILGILMVHFGDFCQAAKV